MKLKVLSSNSKANGYVLTNGEETLVLEAGVNLKTVKRAIGYNVASIAGLIVTHSHLDHSRCLCEYPSQGITCLAPQDVFSRHNISGVYCKAAGHLKGYSFGRFKIMAFDVPHDVPTMGYIIEHPDMGKMMFVTDTYQVDYTFKGLTHLLLEVNFADDILNNNFQYGYVSRFMKDRLYGSHMELSVAIELLKTNDIKDVKTITLCHLSSKNSDSDRFIEEIAAATGKTVYVASQGVEVDLQVF